MVRDAADACGVAGLSRRRGAASAARQGASTKGTVVIVGRKPLAAVIEKHSGDSAGAN